MKRSSRHRYLIILTVALVAFTGFAAYTAAGPRPAPPPGSQDPVARVRTERRFAVPQEVVDRVRQGPLSRAQSYESYMTLGHDSDKITVEVPAAWNDIEYLPWIYQGHEVGVSLMASTDLEAFGQRSAPGVFLGVSRLLTETSDPQAVLEAEGQGLSSSCARGRRFNYHDAIYKGWFESFACNGPSTVLTAVTTTPDGGFIVLIRVVVHSPADLEAAKRIFDTFQVVGNPEQDEHHDH